MASAAQALANTSNAQKSTGPRTEEGKANSKRNSMTHGLNSEPSTLFAHAPDLAEQYSEFCEQFHQEAPETPHEQLCFDRWTYAAFQAIRARSLEAMAESDMRAHFGEIEYERRWHRFVQTRQRLQREADSALKEMLDLQNIRLDALDAAIAAEEEAERRAWKVDLDRALEDPRPLVTFGDYVAGLQSDDPKYQASYQRLLARFPLGSEAKPDDTWEIKKERSEQWRLRWDGKPSRLKSCGII